MYPKVREEFRVGDVAVTLCRFVTTSTTFQTVYRLTAAGEKRMPNERSIPFERENEAKTRAKRNKVQRYPAIFANVISRMKKHR